MITWVLKQLMQQNTCITKSSKTLCFLNNLYSLILKLIVIMSILNELIN